MLPVRVYLLIVAGFVLCRLFELRIARRNARRAFARGAVELGAGHYPIMVAMHVAFFASCALEPLILPRLDSWLVVSIAVVTALLAFALRFWAIATLGERWNTRIIVIPDSPPIARGPYRLVRHPNYVAVIAEFAALPLIGGAWRTALVFSALNAMMLRARIRAEEQALGPKYSETFAPRPRFIPRLR